MISSGPFHCRLNFSATSFGYRDRWGGRYDPPPPLPQRAGVGLGPAGRGLTQSVKDHSPQAVDGEGGDVVGDGAAAAVRLTGGLRPLGGQFEQVRRHGGGR